MPTVMLTTTRTVERTARKAKIPRERRRKAKASTTQLSTSRLFSLSKTKEPSPPKVKAKARATSLKVRARKKEADPLAKDPAREEVKGNEALPKEEAREMVLRQDPHLLRIP